MPLSEVVSFIQTEQGVILLFSNSVIIGLLVILYYTDRRVGSSYVSARKNESNKNNSNKRSFKIVITSATILAAIGVIVSLFIVANIPSVESPAEIKLKNISEEALVEALGTSDEIVYLNGKHGDYEYLSGGTIYSVSIGGEDNKTLVVVITAKGDSNIIYAGKVSNEKQELTKLK